MSTLKASVRKISIRTLIFLGYLFLGAGIFFGIEGHSSEMRYKRQYNSYTQEKENFKMNHNITEKEYLIMEKHIREAFKNGIIGNSFESRWSFGNAFFFCGNVITTIGYGTIVPKTIPGKLVMVIYALLGIPLTGFFLRTVGNELTNLIAYIVKIYERRMFNREAERLEIKCAIVAGFLACFMLLFGAGLFSFTATETVWDFMNSFYFCFVSLTTIGFGDLVPGQDSTNQYQTSDGERLAVEMALLIYYVLGLSIMSGVIVSISSVIEEKTKKLDITDPMDAIRNLRIENLNSKAMKKLGYKVDEGITPGRQLGLPPTLRNGQLVKRRGTIIPDDETPSFKKKGIANLLNNNTKNSPNETNGFVKNGTARLSIPNDKASQLTVVDISPIPSPHKLATPNETEQQIHEEQNHTEREQIIDQIKIRTISVSTKDSDGDTADDNNDNHQLDAKNQNHQLDAKNHNNHVVCNNHTNNHNNNNITNNNHSNYSNNNTSTNNNHDTVEKTDSKAYLVIDDSKRTEKEYCYINGIRISASSKIKTSNHHLNSKDKDQSVLQSKATKLFQALTNNSPLRHSEDKLPKEDSKVDKINIHNSGESRRNRKRIGLPAELFANRVSITLNIPDDDLSEVGRDTSFFDIPLSSPLPIHESGLQNPFFQSDEYDPPKSATRSLDMTDMKRFNKKRRSSTGGFSSC